MHVNKTKTMAILGVLAALSTVLTVLGTVISVDTVFFTAAAAFLAGIVVIRFGMGYGTVFFAVCASLDFIFNPNKLHVFLYLAFAGYLLLSEGSYRLLQRIEGRKKEWIHRGIRLLVFATFYIPLLCCVPQLLVSERILNLTVFYPAHFFSLQNHYLNKFHAQENRIAFLSGIQRYGILFLMF